MSFRSLHNQGASNGGCVPPQPSLFALVGTGYKHMVCEANSEVNGDNLKFKLDRFFLVTRRVDVQDAPLGVREVSFEP
ncbi:MAG: hypothetical protein ACO20S_13240, partial [Paracoccaceae bacterium]